MAKKENLEEKLKQYSPEDMKILDSLYKKGLSMKDIQLTINAIQKGNPNTQDSEYRVGKSHVKYMVFGDTHIGNVNYDSKLMSFAAKQATKEKVDFIIHTGDVMDGWYQNRPQAIFEQDAIGLDQQFNKTVKEFSKLEQPLYFITGNHEFNTFMRGAGIEVGPYLQDKLNSKGIDAHFLGNAEGDIKLSSGAIIKNMHPDGGTAYALSYKPQKIIESITQEYYNKLMAGSKKIAPLPAIVNIGHFHKADYMFYQGIHTFQTATLMGQTKFMRGKQIPAHKGFFIVDVYTRAGGQVDKITPSYYPSYK